MAAVPSIGRASGVEALDAATNAVAHDLYQRHYSRVFGLCRKRLRSHEEAEDAAQTTFYYAVGALRRGVVPAAEAPWLLKIAQNVCLNRWAANGRRARLEVASDPQVLQEIAPAQDESDDDLSALQHALESLTEQQRRAIVLREWHGLSYREIAAELELSQSAVETLIFRARRSLARHLRGGRLRSGLDLGALLAAAKSLLTGGSAGLKIAAGVAALAVGAGVAAPRVEHAFRHPTAPPVSPKTAGSGTDVAADAPAPVTRSSTPVVAPRQPSARKRTVTHAVVPIFGDRPVATSGGTATTGGGSEGNGSASDAPAGGGSSESPQPGTPTPAPTQTPPTQPAPTTSVPDPASGLPPSQPVSVPTVPSAPAPPEVPQVPSLPPAPPLPTDPVTGSVVDTTTSVVNDTTSAVSNVVPKLP